MGGVIARDIERARLPRAPLARLRAWLREPFIVGPDECPIMYRWAVIGGASPTSKPLLFPGFKRWTLKVHHFMPNRDDRDVHDHPWPFLTVVLWGSYDDLVPCPGSTCERASGVPGLPRTRVPFVMRHPGGYWTACTTCGGTGLVIGDRMRAGVARWRGPDHAHRTRTGPSGAWTLVITGNRLDRPWGFFPAGTKVRWDEYIELHGSGRCD